MLNAIFLAVVAVVALVAIVMKRSPSWKAVGVVAVIVLVMTAIFDNIMISVGLVGYDESKISGALIGIAPLEDFAYAVAAIVMLPALWSLLHRRDRHALSAEGRANDA